MKPARFIPVVLIPLLIACSPKKPEISLPAIPAGPLIEALDQHRQALSGLKAVASVAVVRSGRRRFYDTVGIVLDGRRRLRLEVYGPLGQSLVTLIWDGPHALLRREDGRVVHPSSSDLEKLFGVAMDAEDLCAVLTGNVPARALSAATDAFRNPDGSALVVLSEGGTERRVFMMPAAGSARSVSVTAEELYRSDRLVYRVRYQDPAEVSQYLIAKTVVIESPEQNTTLTVVFNDMDVNAPLPDDAFTLPGEAGALGHE